MKLHRLLKIENYMKSYMKHYVNKELRDKVLSKHYNSTAVNI